MRAVVDTNVWVSGLIAPGGPPGQVLTAIRERRSEAVASWELAGEIVDVLRRPKVARYGVSDDDVADVLDVLGPLLPRVDVDVPIRDPDDVPVIAAALATAAEVVITGDADLLADAAVGAWLRRYGVAVLTPTEALSRLDAAR